MVGYIELIKREELSDIVRDYVDVIQSGRETKRNDQQFI